MQQQNSILIAVATVASSLFLRLQPQHHKACCQPQQLFLTTASLHQVVAMSLCAIHMCNSSQALCAQSTKTGIYPLNKDTTAGNATKLTVQQISLVRFTLAENGDFLASATLLTIPRKNGEKKEVETMPAGHSCMLANILGVV